MRFGFLIAIVLSSILAWRYSTKTTSPSNQKTHIVYPAAMEDLTYEKNHALSHLNRIREAMGMNRLVEDQTLDLAAQNHADYLVANHEKSHYETKGKPKFTGITPVERACYVGYPSRQVSENLSTSHYSAQASIDGLLSAIYHRFGFLDLGIDVLGIGITQNPAKSKESAFVYEMANSMLRDLCEEESFKGIGRYAYKICADEQHRIEINTLKRAQNYHRQHNPKILLYPYDGQVEVPPAFYAEEPDPLPDMEVSGFPVSVMFNPYYFPTVNVIDFALFDSDTGIEIDTRLMDRSSDPHHRFTPYEFALFPLERLSYNHLYHAQIVYRSKGEEKTRTWSFRTIDITEDFYRIEGLNETVVIDSHRSSVFYFKPLNSHEILHEIHYPNEISLTFLDNHTIRLTPLSGSKKDFILKVGKRKITVKIK